MCTNVFILDDEVGICELIAEVCEIQQFSAVYSADSLHYRKQFDDVDKFGLVFLDLNMPNKDGIEVLRELADFGYKGKVVLMSGFDDSVLSSAGELAEEFGLRLLPALKKPFTVRDVFKILQSYSPEEKKDIPNKPCDAHKHDAEKIRCWLENGHVVMHYQPQVDMLKNTLVGVESLVRLLDDRGNTIYPGEFIDIIENNGMNKLLLEKVVEQVCADYEDFHPYLCNLNISINVSALDLDRLTFPDELYQRVQESKLHPDSLTVEITETRAMAQASKGLDILARLRLKGFHLSIDDFGTGEAVLGHIRKMPYNELKIDRSFVSQVTTNPRTYSLTRDLIYMAQHLGLKIVAEGIEDEATLEALKIMGCEIAQGFFVAKPMPMQELVSWMRNV